MKHRSAELPVTILLCIQQLIGSHAFAARHTSSMSSVLERPVRPSSEGWINAFVIGLGTYNSQSAAYLAKTATLSSPSDEVFPVIVDEGAVALLSNTMANTEDRSRASLLYDCQALVNRDGTLYDELPWSEWGGDLAKRSAFARFQGKDLPNNATSAYSVMAHSIATDCSAKIVAALLERDTEDQGTVTLGGAICIEKLPELISFWGESIVKPFSGGQQAIVECTVDEALGIALSQQMPVRIEQSLWESATVRDSPRNNFR
jgi:hypothetical protein